MTKPLYFINNMNHDRKTHLQVKNQTFFVSHVLENKKELILSFLYAHPSLPVDNSLCWTPVNYFVCINLCRFCAWIFYLSYWCFYLKQYPCNLQPLYILKILFYAEFLRFHSIQLTFF